MTANSTRCTVSSYSVGDEKNKTDFLLYEVHFMHRSATALWRPRVNTKSRRIDIDAAERFQGATTVFEVFKEPLLFSK